MVRAVSVLVALAMLPVAAAQAADEVSTTDRLPDRREVAAGDRAYAIGFQDGGWYANGWHITGEMGGIWAPPLKLADGVWFGVDDQWVGPATRFTSGRGYVRYELPPVNGVKMTPHRLRPRRRPRRAVRAHARRAAARITVKVDVHSELLPAYPWSGSEGHPTAADNGQDTVTAAGRRARASPTARTPPSRAPSQPRDRRARPGPASAARAPGASAGATRRRRRSACDDGPIGSGAGGQLRYRVQLGTSPSRCGSRSPATRADLDQGAEGPGRDARATSTWPARSCTAAAAWTCPATAASRTRSTRASRTSPTSRRRPRTWQIRFVDRGKAYPRPIGTRRPRSTFIGAGYPDYPWLFATDGEYTAFAAVALGQFEPIKDHLIALATGLGSVEREVGQGRARDRHRRLGLLRRRTPTRATPTSRSSSRAPSRWCGAGAATTASSTASTTSRGGPCATSSTTSTPTRTAGRRASATSSARAWAAEKLDNTVYLIRGLNDLADMAASKRDRATRALGVGSSPRSCAARSTRRGGTRSRASTPTRSGDNNAQSVQQHWIGVTPMETGLGAARARQRCARRARDRLLQRLVAVQPRPLPHGLHRRPGGQGREGHLQPQHRDQGRRRRASTAERQQRRYTDANAVGVLDEQPGALPEILPSPDQNRNIDRCWTCRSMFMQAWGHYGTAWPVIAQQLGVRPQLGARRLDVVPQDPGGPDADRGQLDPARRRRDRRGARRARRRRLHDAGHGP